ncbi:MAG: hypothetical protein U0234_27415 [Sandaracinus sp.]
MPSMPPASPETDETWPPVVRLLALVTFTAHASAIAYLIGLF